MLSHAECSPGLLDYFHLSFTLCELEPLRLQAVHLELCCEVIATSLAAVMSLPIDINEI